MIVSWNWLSQYLKLDMPVDELTDRLMMAGLNHEGTEEVDGDFAIDLEVTSNRADCLCHLGIAREVGVLFDRRVNEPDPRPDEAGAPVASVTSVDVREPALCPLFTARVVSGVSIGESPWWLKGRLKTLGVRSVSNIVDITNYVMFECGQPLHTYDLDLLEGKRLVVRRAAAGEAIKAINGKTYELGSEMLAIADAARPVGLAGVMGGLDTEIGAATRNVLIEAAVFDPMLVRTTARALGLHSPSSFRFERGVDPARTEWASRRCAELILELAGGVLHPGVIAVGAAARVRDPIAMRFSQLARVLGIEVPNDRAAEILRALGLVEESRLADRATFTPPSWRPDLEREIYLIEEVARIHGYEHIPEDRDVPLISSVRSRRDRVAAEVRAALTGLGFDEACTPSLVAEGLDVPLVAGPVSAALRVDHSTRRLENVLRRGLLPSLLTARALNEARHGFDAELFELASVYLPRDDERLPFEPAHLAMVAGRDFGGMKGVIETLAARLRVGSQLISHPAETPLFAAGRSAELRIDGKSLGFVGELSAQTRARFDLRTPCSGAELDLDVLIARAELIARYRPLPEFPAVERDLSLVLDRGVAWAELAGAAHSAGGPHLESVAFLDTFRGKGIREGAHSVHFGLKFRHPERTLDGGEVDQYLAAIVALCKERFQAELRS